MNPLTALVVIAALVAVATLIGVLGRVRSGRVRHASGKRLTAELLGLDAPLGASATIVQFSTVYCGPCRVAERILTPLASEPRGVRYADVDLGRRPQLAGRLGIVQTPTILLLDAAGRIASRIVGVPRAADVAARIEELTEEDHVVA
ncbi:thioredoxin family protein [Humibacter sp.]|jgi:thiol-disulfide isomerase/thioredoxin|uniref:TlpA family protein disulfide reductase n=1 Tax=Humibacter sp. TaxID=1940291 RepID=UPI002CDAB4AF|nr:thioredoxin family protein [Humibacter sp.]HVX06340.1 thioredoxin family protein [Humibacter sp.]